ncbi:MAG: DUF5667 domain-containing protein [Candidatus Paceibacterota bacterium]
MKNNKLQKGINEIRNIKMTNSEKELIFSNILKSSSKIIKPIKSPWLSFSFIMMLKRKQLVYYIIIPLLIILSSGGVVFASVDSLPDSILYPLKVNIVEPIRGALTFSHKNKAKYEVNLATERLIEAETLASQGKLTKTNEKRLNDLLESHTKSLDKALDVVKKTEPKEQTDEIIKDFSSEMNVHAEVLNIIKNKKDNNNEENQISKNAKINAEHISDRSKNKENHTFNEKDLKFESKNNKEKDNNQ